MVVVVVAVDQIVVVAVVVAPVVVGFQMAVVVVGVVVAVVVGILLLDLGLKPSSVTINVIGSSAWAPYTIG